MKTMEDIISEMQSEANKVAKLYRLNTPECKAAYALGVRAMATMISVCINIAEQMKTEHSDNPVVSSVFDGYANSLRQILNITDDLIPEGYEP